jgi:hypothetical protein
VRFQTPLYVDDSPKNGIKEQAKLSSNTIKSLVSSAFATKFKNKAHTSSPSEATTKEKLSNRSKTFGLRAKTRKLEKPSLNPERYFTTYNLFSKVKKKMMSAVLKINAIGSIMQAPKVSICIA